MDRWLTLMEEGSETSTWPTETKAFFLTSNRRSSVPSPLTVAWTLLPFEDSCLTNCRVQPSSSE